MKEKHQSEIIDPESFGGTDFPPIITPEEEYLIKSFYAKNLEILSLTPDEILAETARTQRVQNIQEQISSKDKVHVFTEPGRNDPFYPDDAWIQTYSGRRFNPTNPHVDAIVIQDIAHALSMQCRFSGHCRKFYSVAQHSVLVSHICDHDDALWGLMHDASEAYLVDIPRPLKRSGKFDAYRELETIMTKAICKRFGLPEQEPISVKRADTILLATEARDLMQPLRADWVQPAEPLPFNIESWSPQEAKSAFMKRFFQLIGADPHHYQHYLEYENNS